MFDGDPLDPTTNDHYTYSVTADRSQYEIAAVLETGLFSMTPVENANAAGAAAVITRIV